MICVRKILALFIIFMMLVPFVCAGDTKHVGDEKVVSEKPTTEKVTDKTKEKTTEITSKDKSITGKITVTDNDISKYKVEKKSSTEISISKEEAKGEHTKAKVSFPKSELQKIDIDKDGKFGLLHISDTGEVTHTTATEAELVAGKVMTFSTNIVNGYSGYKQYTFSDVESGDTLNIDDVSGNYTITAAVDGVVPTYMAGIPTDGLRLYLPLKKNATDMSGNGLTTNTNMLEYKYGGAWFNGVDSSVTVTDNDLLDVGLNATYIWRQNITTANYKFKTIFNRNVQSASSPYTWKLTEVISNKRYWVQYYNGVTKVNVYPVVQNVTDNEFLLYNILSSGNPSVFSKYGGTPTQYNVTNRIPPTSGNLYIGRYQTSTTYTWNGGIRDVGLYAKKLNASEISQFYAGGSGISFQPEPSYNFTGYNVASGVEKVLNTDSTCTGIEYVDTTGGTHDVTVTVYFTEDITVISDIHTATMQTVNISHTSSNTAQDGELIPYDILDEYFGTIDFDTTNPNATITRNATDFMVDTGYITANTTYYYNVSIPNYVEEMVWSDWDPTNETCNAKVQISNSTPYTTWNITTYNVTNNGEYKIIYADNGTEVGSARAFNGSASIIITGLQDGTYWLVENAIGYGLLSLTFIVSTFMITAFYAWRRRT